MRVLVTGGAGFIGSHIVYSLKNHNEAAVLDDFSSGKIDNLPEGIKIYRVDVRDRDAVFAAFAEYRPTHVSHQAAQISVSYSVEEPAFDASVNVLGGLNVLDAAREFGVERVVFASTGGAIYGEVPEGEKASESWLPRPASPYAASKASFEDFLEVYRQQYGLSYTILRYGNVYGPRQDPHGEAGVVAIFTRRLLESKPVRVYAREKRGDEGGIRDYVYVADVVAANLMALQEGLDGVYNVASGHGRTTTEVLRAVADSLGVEPEIEWQGVRPGDLRRSVLDVSKLRAHGWQPRVEFEEGIEKTVAWFKDNY
ncbi:NAD-dependent epimerase/dehydratase family protein [Oceanithermus sp.]